MRTSTVLLAAVAAVLLFAGAQAQNTKGQYSHGYTYASDVQGYTNMTLDLCDIWRAWEAKDNAAIINIFMNGKNSRRGSGLRSFNLWSTSNQSGFPLFDAMYEGHNITYFNDWFTAAVNAGSYREAWAIIKGPIMMQYMMHEYEEASEKVKVGNINDDTGAPHNVDEAWGMWVGGHGPGFCNGTSLADDAQTLAEEMGLEYTGYSATNLAMIYLTNDITAMARHNDSEGAEEAYEHLYEQAWVFGVSHLLRDVYAAQAARGCRNGPLEKELRAVAAVTASWILPLMETVGADVSEIEAALMANNYQYTKIRNAIYRATAKLDPEFDVENFGTPNPRTIRQHLGLPGSC
mmetsp:Transcript_34549/g.76768  ORF Transcript_34549/g.76768 Transcript_34549/m.76768 type:complete len:348 (+) Transcript_34549:68-1111(+)